MDEDRNLSENSQEQPFERKCERQFRQLFKSSFVKTYGRNKTKKKSEFTSNEAKRRKADESSSSMQCSSSSLATLDKPEKITCPDIEDEIRKPDGDLQAVVKLVKEGSLKERCKSVIKLASFSMGDISDTQLCTLFDVLNLLSYVYESDAFAVSYSLFLLALTKKNLNASQVACLEHSILRASNSVGSVESAGCSPNQPFSISTLQGDTCSSAVEICRQCLSEKTLQVETVDFFTICCSSLRNLTLIEGFQNYTYSENTLKFILGMTGRSTQEIVSSRLEGENHCKDFISVPSHTVNQCLLILEHILSVDPDSHRRRLDHEHFSILHCLTRLLGWCLSVLFQEQSEVQPSDSEHTLSPFHLAALVSILKILSILSFNPDQYDTFTNVKGLMEKVMICILKVYFHSAKSHFDVLVLSLELMINFFIKHKKTFAILCLKNFPVTQREQLRGIEALLKMLHNSLDKIAEVKSKCPAESPREDAPQDSESVNQSSQTNETDRLKLVLADEDMELSTIVSFISILVAFFMEIKASFVDFVRERLPVERSSEAVTVSRKVLEFASITGGMPATGLLLLRHAIRKLSRLYPVS